jgi:hypothetical protein
MSIYEGTRVPRWTPTSQKPAAEAVVPAPVHLRKAQPADVVVPRTLAWIASLPADARPHALAKRYARIANNFACCWDQPSVCAKYFDDLLIDRRGGRKGFPADVLHDLQRLKAAYVRGFGKRR